LQLKSEGPYLQGKVEFPLSRRILYRDEGSTANSLSNVGLANLVEASFKEMSIKTSAFGIPQFTHYVETRTETAKSFNINSVIDTCKTLLSSFDEGSLQGITTAATAVGETLNSSLEKKEEGNKATMLNLVAVFDYDPIFDEVIAVIEIIIYDFELNAWKTIEKNKLTTKEEEFVMIKNDIESSRIPINLVRLVKIYPPEEGLTIDAADKDPVGPPGNVATLLAPDASLLPLPKPDLAFISSIRDKINEETGVRVSRHAIGDHVPQGKREPGLKVHAIG